MRVGFIILCRFNSKRLPGKVLTNIAGKPLIAYIIERLETVNLSNTNIIVATSNSRHDDPIESYCISEGINIYRGSLSDVSNRFLNAAKEFEIDIAVRVNGDNIFGDTKMLHHMLSDFLQINPLFMTNVNHNERIYPKGFSIEIVNVDFYSKVISEFTSAQKEHVMTYFYPTSGNKKKIEWNMTEFKWREFIDINLSIDTLEDKLRVEKIITNMTKPHYKYDINQVVELLANEI